MSTTRSLFGPLETRKAR